MAEPRLSSMAAFAGVQPSVEVFLGAYGLVNPCVGASPVTGAGGPTPPTTPPGFLSLPMGPLPCALAPVVTASSQPDRTAPVFSPDCSGTGDSGGGTDLLFDGQQPSKYRQGHLSFSRTRSPTLESSAYQTRTHTHSWTSRMLEAPGSLALRSRASYNTPSLRPTAAPEAALTQRPDLSLNLSVDGAAATPIPPQSRMLRRKPGGNLRAAKNLEDLGANVPRRLAVSVTSLTTTYTDSFTSSFLRGTADDNDEADDGKRKHERQVEELSQRRADTVAALLLTGEAPAPAEKREISLFSTHSSKPIMRPSFEAEAKKLAQIPDDDNDDGGIASALLKLEGRFDNIRPSAEAQTLAPSWMVSQLPQWQELQDRQLKWDDEQAQQQRDENEDQKPDEQETQAMIHLGLGTAKRQQEIGNRRHGHIGLKDGMPPMAHGERPLVAAPATEEHSFPAEAAVKSSDPLLHRSATGAGWSGMVEGPLSGLDDGEGKLQDLTMMADDGGAMRSRPSLQRPMTGVTADQQLFLWDVEDDSERKEDDGVELASDLSSELSSVDGDSAEVWPYDGRKITPLLPAHALAASPDSQKQRQESVPVAVATPPAMGKSVVTSAATKRMADGLREKASVLEVHEQQLWKHKPLPPMPPTAPAAVTNRVAGRVPIGTTKARRSTLAVDEAGWRRSMGQSAHLPFILAFESEVLAQQFTLIETDALNEMDWRELVTLSWRNSTGSHDVRSWVDFLRTADAGRGVEVVIARFNLMVKWAVSEVVLTRDTEERARCVVKLVHIALHCRRFRNFATMAQLTIALGSRELAGMTRTWAMVPAADRRAVAELERLLLPTRNFYLLRAEMETDPSGCVPLLSIYTQDLLFNAQRPLRLANGLVNFERWRCAAAIVKTVLRLLEAGVGHGFAPVDGVTERCLWMRALADDEIRRLAAALE